MSEKKTRTLNVPGIPSKDFDFLKELAKPYGNWKTWLKNIQESFRKAREEVLFHKEKVDFLEQRLKEANDRIEILKQYAPKQSSSVPEGV